MTGNKALVVVDLQSDFCPGGALPAEGGDKIVTPIMFTRDWHPKGHSSFKAQNGQWPPHCVQHTPGAEFHPSLRVPANAIVISKATRKEEDAYSGFQGTDLAERLRRVGVKELFVCGLAMDYCVKNTVLDAIDLGFQTHVVTDCVKGVDLVRGDSSKALRSMVAKGAGRTTSAKLLKEISRRVAISSSS
jgi:nicotinamidase/pyrazinamidase